VRRQGSQTIQEFAIPQEIRLQPRIIDWHEDLREETSQRLSDGNNQIPVIENSLDSEFILRANGNSDFDNFRVGIMENLRENRCDPGLQSYFMRQMNDETLERVGNILRLSANSENYMPIINILLLSVGVEGDISNSIQELMRNQVLEEGIRENDRDLRQEVERIDQTTNVELERARDTANGEINRLNEQGRSTRLNIFNRINWSNMLNRAGGLVLGGIGLYAASPYFSPMLVSLGNQIGPTLMESLRPGREVTSRTGRVHWEDVSSLFYNAWEQYFRWMRGG
jgi:hypothetical protein